MNGYTKLFSSIITSTIWQENTDTRIVWVTLLALADQHGEIHASVPGLAHQARVSREACEAALTKFLSPDPDSRTKDFDGRRIATIEGGWELFNHAMYRVMSSKEDRKAQNAERQRRFKTRHNKHVHTGNARSNATALPVTHTNAKVTHEWDIAEADTEADTEANNTLPFDISVPQQDSHPTAPAVVVEKAKDLAIMHSCISSQEH